MGPPRGDAQRGIYTTCFMLHVWLRVKLSAGGRQCGGTESTQGRSGEHPGQVQRAAGTGVESLGTGPESTRDRSVEELGHVQRAPGQVQRAAGAGPKSTRNAGAGQSPLYTLAGARPPHLQPLAQLACAELKADERKEHNTPHRQADVDEVERGAAADNGYDLM
eukprot:352767-Chlamydomonas_euryale.AAC.1